MSSFRVWGCNWQKQTHSLGNIICHTSKKRLLDPGKVFSVSSSFVFFNVVYECWAYGNTQTLLRPPCPLCLCSSVALPQLNSHLKRHQYHRSSIKGDLSISYSISLSQLSSSMKVFWNNLNIFISLKQDFIDDGNYNFCRLIKIANFLHNCNSVFPIIIPPRTSLCFIQAFQLMSLMSFHIYSILMSSIFAYSSCDSDILLRCATGISIFASLTRKC